MAQPLARLFQVPLQQAERDGARGSSIVAASRGAPLAFKDLEDLHDDNHRDQSDRNAHHQLHQAEPMLAQFSVSSTHQRISVTMM
jgi:hypothetical protein